VTSPQAFEGLRTSGRSVRRPSATLATVDHNVPTSDRSGYTDVESFIKEEDSRTQVSPERPLNVSERPLHIFERPRKTGRVTKTLR
jgi:hypothetical protein